MQTLNDTCMLKHELGAIFSLKPNAQKSHKGLYTSQINGFSV